jgi:hypothetical protein
MSGVVDFRTLLEDENGNPINALNPLPTTGGGGGGGALADVLLTDSNGAIFVSRDDGTTVTYFNLNTNAVYTPVGTISAPSSGGGGSALADVLLTDTTGAIFVSRDNGVTVTYFNLNTNAVYTPVGTISAAPVAVSNIVADELLDGLQTLLIRLLNATNSPRGYDVALGRNRVTALIESGTVTTVGTVSTVTAVNGVANIGSIGNQQAQLLTNGQNVSAWAATVRSRIT